MGFFDRFKKRESMRKPYGPNLIEIARLISNGDQAVLCEISACTQAPQAWFESHREQYSQRGINTAGSLEWIQWLGLADILAGHNYVCERDWKDERDDFLFFLQQLKGFQALHLSVDPAWLDGGQDIPIWCNILAEQWEPQGVRIAAIGIDSDSYVLFPCPVAQLPTLQRLAGELGQYIESLEGM